jgi:putative SbcD/Mre11-related phosphoesterase
MLTPVKNYPALIYKQKKQKILIISDLHLGWELNLIQKGIHIPSQTIRIQNQLLHLLKTTKPDTLTILGDIKHTIAKAKLSEWQDIPLFFKTIKTEINKIEILRGNHDGNLEPLLDPAIQLHPSSGITLNNVGLLHGHTWPAKKLLECNTLVMGHVHPTVSFHDQLGFHITSPVWIKAKCNPKQFATKYLERRYKKSKLKTTSQIAKTRVKELIIMPCFNTFLGGRAINREKSDKSYIGPILRSQSIDLEEAEIYLLDGTYLGKTRQLKTTS